MRRRLQELPNRVRRVSDLFIELDNSFIAPLETHVQNREDGGYEFAFVCVPDLHDIAIAGIVQLEDVFPRWKNHPARNLDRMTKGQDRLFVSRVGSGRP
jgi:hypothetical protein